MSGTTTEAFVPGDLVISIYGDGDGSGAYADNQASPITLAQIDPLTGAIVPITGAGNATLVNGELVLPQASGTNAAGVVENAVSGEYGSSSEGTLELAANGQSLVIAGYAVNAATFNAGEAGIADSGTGGIYGNQALAQSTSIPGGSVPAIARAIADIGFNGTVDSSTALFNVDNTNNPRSVATVDGSSFYLSGQGVKGDTTQGVFLARDGAGSATAIDTSTDTRTVEISNGQLYVSRDSKQGPTAGISTYGTLPTGTTAPTTLAGISNSITLTAAEENTVNASKVGATVYLSPENFFFADATTLYVADSGNPKQGGTGDGGLQKWSLAGGTWHLDYTLSAGLNLVKNSATAGTTGLIGLTGVVTGGTVELYATNATVGDLDPTALYGITDQLAATTAPAGASFRTLVTAAADTNIRGVALAPTEAACFLPGTLIRTPAGEVPIEALRIGDEVSLVTGGTAPVRWVARQTVATRFADPLRAHPVRVTAGALGANLPARDLLLSPDHALFADGVLVQAGALVNGTSIRRESRVPERITYYNLELASHALIWAEGAVAETFIDNLDRGVFDNADEHAALYPDAAPMVELELPRAKAARQVPAALRRRLAAQARAAEAHAA